MVVHQRQGPVLQFSRRIGLGVNIGNLLEFERAFEGDGELLAATEKQGVLLFHIGFKGGFDQGVQLQYLAAQIRQQVQGLHQLLFLGLGQTPVFRQGNGKNLQRHQLGGEGLGGGDADLGASGGHQGQIGLPHQGAVGHIADGERTQIAVTGAGAQGRQGIGRFTGL